PPVYNFVHTPLVATRHPLWDASPELSVVTGLRSDRREVLVTTVIDAEPDYRHHHPGSSIWPIVLAASMAATFIGAIFSPWFVPAGLGGALLVLLGWGWQGSQFSGTERVALPDNRIVEAT